MKRHRFLNSLRLYIIAAVTFSTGTVCAAQPDFTYYNEDTLNRLAREKRGLLLISTGFSETALGNMRALQNGEKQKRGLAHSFYTLLDFVFKKHGRGKLIYISTNAMLHYEKTNARFVNSRILRSHLLHLFQAFTGNYQEADFDRFMEESVSFYELNPKMKASPMEQKLSDLNFEKNGVIEFSMSGTNVEIMNQIRDQVSALKAKGYYTPGFSAHLTGDTLTKWAEYIGVPPLGVTSSDLNAWGRKTKSKDSFNLADVAQARGIIGDDGTMYAATSVEALSNNILALYKNGVKKIMIKLDSSAAGKGNHEMDLSDYSGFETGSNPLTIEMIEEKVQSLKDESDEPGLVYGAAIGKPDQETSFVRKMNEKGAIAEERIDGKDCTSPATLGVIDSNGEVKIYYVYNQVLGGSIGQNFGGAIGGPGIIDEELDSELREKATKIAKVLAKEGVRGYVGTDFLVCSIKDSAGKETRKSFAIENNVRQTGTMYPYRIAYHLLGEKVFSKKFMYSNDAVKLPVDFNSFCNWSEYTAYVNYIFGKFSYGNEPEVVFNRSTQTGALFSLDTHGLGKVGIMSIGDSKEQAEEFVKKFKSKMAHYTSSYFKTVGPSVCERKYEHIQNDAGRIMTNIPAIDDPASRASAGRSLGSSVKRRVLSAGPVRTTRHLVQAVRSAFNHEDLPSPDRQVQHKDQSSYAERTGQALRGMRLERGIPGNYRPHLGNEKSSRNDK